MFHFDIEEKTLAVDERLTFNVKFQSKILGEFSETFKWRLEGTEDLLNLTFKGHVIAPTFSFNVEQVDFKRVSFMFTETMTIQLTNTSEVDFRFNLHIPGDKDIDDKEFEITPAQDLIKSHETKNIMIQFTPKALRKYELVLVVNILEVGDDMLSLPIRAESEAPTVKIEPGETLDFEKVFLNHPYTKQIHLTNDSNLRAKYRIIP